MSMVIAHSQFVSVFLPTSYVLKWHNRC